MQFEVRKINTTWKCFLWPKKYIKNTAFCWLFYSHTVCVCSRVYNCSALVGRVSLGSSSFFLLYFACYLSFFQKFQPQSVCVCLKQQGIFGHPFFSLLLFAHRSPSFGSATMINIIVAAAVVHRFRCRCCRRRFIRRTDPKGNPTSIKYRCCCKFFNSLTHTQTPNCTDLNLTTKMIRI